MKTRSTRLIQIALAAAFNSLLATGADAAIARWDFSQTGFDEGASVSGWFTGADNDSDGWIFSFELTDFLLSFSGNSLVQAFTHSYANGSGPGNFAYFVGSATFDPEPYGGLWTFGATGDNDGDDLVRYASFEWEAENAPGMVINVSTGALSATSQALSVTAVPAPSASALMGAGLLGLAMRRRSGGNG